MGDVADALINGDFDERTGEYLGPGSGFPRSLEDDDYLNEYDVFDECRNYLAMLGTDIATENLILQLEWNGLPVGTRVKGALLPILSGAYYVIDKRSYFKGKHPKKLRGKKRWKFAPAIAIEQLSTSKNKENK